MPATVNLTLEGMPSPRDPHLHRAALACRVRSDLACVTTGMALA